MTLAPASIVDCLISTKSADFGVDRDVRARSEARVRPDDRPARDPRALEMREGSYHRAILDAASGPDHDMGFDQNVAANFCVKRQKHGFGGGQRRAGGHGAQAQPVLQRRLRGGKLRPGH